MLLHPPPGASFPGANHQAFPPEGFFPAQPTTPYKWFPHPPYYQFDPEYTRAQPYMYAHPEFYPVEGWPSTIQGTPLAVLAAPDAAAAAAAASQPLQGHMVPEVQFPGFPFDPHHHEVYTPSSDQHSNVEWQRTMRHSSSHKPLQAKASPVSLKPRAKATAVAGHANTAPVVQVRKRDAKQVVDDTMTVDVLHKPRGSQGVWVPVDPNQRVRVTYGRGKNVRVVVRCTQRRDWSSLRLFLVEHQDDDSEPVVEKESKHSFSIEAREVKADLSAGEVPLQMVQFEVKVFMIHATISFRAEFDAPESTNTIFIADSVKMSTHNSGRRDAEAKRKAAQAKQTGQESPNSKHLDGLYSPASSEDEVGSPKNRGKRKAQDDSLPPMSEDPHMQPPPTKLPAL